MSVKNFAKFVTGRKMCVKESRAMLVLTFAL